MRKINLCTYYDSNYLDKGIVLYNSLMESGDDITLYVLAFDDECFDILTELDFKNQIVVSYREIEYKNPELLELKSKRSRGEYCWTCTPIIIKYFLEQYDMDMITYVDADMYFFNSPRDILSELSVEKYSVGVMGHRFANPGIREKMIAHSGRFCVEFNSFKNDDKAKALLDIWEKQCIDECTYDNCGDQRYITNWCDDYDFVHEYEHLGGGVAPWNFGDYRFDWRKHQVSCKGKTFPLVFYHYQGMQYSNDGRVKLCAFVSHIGYASRVKKKDIFKLYIPYLKKTEEQKDFLRKRYGEREFQFGCNRVFDPKKFVLSQFLNGFFRRIKEESIGSAIDFVINVSRKRYDVIDLESERLNDKVVGGF